MIYTVRTRGGVGTECSTLAEVQAACRHYSQGSRDYRPVIVGSDGREYDLMTNDDSGRVELLLKSKSVWDEID